MGRFIDTIEAVMKKFHGSSVPRPRIKKQIPTKCQLCEEKKKQTKENQGVKVLHHTV